MMTNLSAELTPPEGRGRSGERPRHVGVIARDPRDRAARVDVCTGAGFACMCRVQVDGHDRHLGPGSLGGLERSTTNRLTRGIAV
jgi:hypothetical protein